MRGKGEGSCIPYVKLSVLVGYTRLVQRVGAGRSRKVTPELPPPRRTDGITRAVEENPKLPMRS